MLKSYFKLLLFASFLMILHSTLYPCTVAVVAGHATKYGRALLWKNRDSDIDESRVMFFKGEKFDFMGIVNASDEYGKEVWAGVNSAGFCIINSASLNLNDDLKKKEEADSSYKRQKDEEGIFMKQALSVCASTSDFERYLDETSGKRGIDANFGVLDAIGGAAFYETDSYQYSKFDANDPRVAPEGYIIRTNYSFTGKRNDGAGYIRFDRAVELFHKQSATGGIAFDWILRSASRDMVNSMTGINPLSEPLPANAEQKKMYYMNDSIARRSAVATILFQGVKTGDDPGLTIMWTRLGHPLCGVAMPVWLSSIKKAELFQGEKSAPLSKFAMILMKEIFPYKGGNRHQYMNLAPLVNLAGDGFLNKLTGLEDEIINETISILKSDGLNKANIDALQKGLNSKIQSALKIMFPVQAEDADIK
jgi:hypothetical protein